MNNNDAVNVGIAAALVRAGLTFTTVVGKTAHETVTRVFQIPFELTSSTPFTVHGYAGGPLVIAISPLRLEKDDPSRRLAIHEALSTRMAFVRAVPGRGTNAHLIWIEASTPIVHGLESLNSSGAPYAVPFQAVASAVIEIVGEFKDEVAIPEVSSIPISIVDP